MKAGELNKSKEALLLSLHQCIDVFLLDQKKTGYEPSLKNSL